MHCSYNLKPNVSSTAYIAFYFFTAISASLKKWHPGHKPSMPLPLPSLCTGVADKGTSPVLRKDREYLALSYALGSITSVGTSCHVKRGNLLYNLREVVICGPGVSLKFFKIMFSL